MLERLRIFCPCPPRTPTHPCSSLQMPAMARAMAVLCAPICAVVARPSGTGKKLSFAEPIPPHAAPGLARPAGSWGLLPGRALSLRPRRCGRLTLVQGRAWLTVSATGLASTDTVLQAGEGVVLPALSHAVLEAWPGEAPAPPLAWQWAVLPAKAGAGAQADWQQAVADPARELCQAGLALLRAAGRLASGLLRLAGWTVARPWAAWRLRSG